MRDTTMMEGVFINYLGGGFRLSEVSMHNRRLRTQKNISHLFLRC